MRFKTEYKTVSFYSFVQLDSYKEQYELYYNGYFTLGPRPR